MEIEKRPDALAVEAAARAYERMVRADAIVDREGETVEVKCKTEDGEIVVLRVAQHPAVGISDRSRVILRGYLSDLGLTPTGRERLTIDHKAEKPEDLFDLLSSEPRRRKAPELPVN